MSKAIVITNPSGVTLKTKNKYMDDDVAISLSEAENILASNIKKDVSILGVSGTYEGFVPSGSITISENGTYNISAFAEATVSVPGLVPSGTLEISSNGVYDVGSYASASVNVSGGGSEAYEWVDLLLGGVGSVYSGYCPSIIRTNAFAQASYLSDFSPYFSSNWSQIVLSSGAFSSNSGIKNINFLSSSTLKIIYSYALQCLNLETPAVNIRPAERGLQNPFICPNVPLFSYDINSTGTYFLNISSFNGSLVYISVPSGNINVENLHGSFSSLILNASMINFSGFAPASMCNGLEKIDLSNVAFAWNVSWVFYSCQRLSEVNMQFVTEGPMLGFRTFQNCVNLEKLSFKGGSRSYCTMIYTSDYTFASCPKLSKLDFFTSSTTIQVTGSCLFMQTGILSFSGKTTGNPIGRSCFASCSSLKYVRFSQEGTYSTRESIFLNCSNLSYVSFGLDFYEIGSSAFAGCSILPSMALGRVNGRYQNTYIHTGAFMDCYNLSKLYIFYHSDTSTVTNLQHSNAFLNTPIADSSYLGYYGSIYVPDFMYSSFITATNWTIYSDRIVSFPFSEQAQLIEAYNSASYIEE